MGAAPATTPLLSRVESGGVLRSLSDDARGTASVVRSWGAIRVVQLELPPQDLPEGYLLNHSVALNLGAEAASDSNFEGQGWRAHRTPHHGVSVVPAFVPYAARYHDRCEVLVVEVAPEFVATALGAAAAKAEFRPVIGAQDSYSEHVLLALAEEARHGSTSGAVRAESLGTALVAHIVEHDLRQPDLGAAALPSPQLRRVLDYVAAHLDAPLTLRKLADLVGMDVFRFIRTFKQTTGLSPHRYVLEARIARAKELLRDRSLSITEIALRTGFATPSHFSVTFRRIARSTPSTFRGTLT